MSNRRNTVTRVLAVLSTVEYIALTALVVGLIVSSRPGRDPEAYGFVLYFLVIPTAVAALACVIVAWLYSLVFCWWLSYAGTVAG